MEFVGISTDPFGNREVLLSSLHVTTNNDSCVSIKQYGLLDLQKAVAEDTPLKMFFHDHGIAIHPERAELTHNEKTYKLNPLTKYATGDGEELNLGHVSLKLYHHQPVWGIVCSDNVLGYGGHTNRRPEFLNNVSNLVGIPETVNQWEQQTSTYVLKFTLPIGRYGRYEFPNKTEYLEYLGALVVKTLFDYSIYGGPIRMDVISLLRKVERVHPHEIVNYYTVDEFKRYLDSETVPNLEPALPDYCLCSRPSIPRRYNFCAAGTCGRSWRTNPPISRIRLRSTTGSGIF